MAKASKSRVAGLVSSCTAAASLMESEQGILAAERQQLEESS
jgi:hypothetical protein